MSYLRDDKFIDIKCSSGIAGELDFKVSTFPAGEEYVVLHGDVAIESIRHSDQAISVVVSLNSATSKEIMRACLIADALKQLNSDIYVKLSMSYVPYGRQDRVCKTGESFSLNFFADMIKLRFDFVEYIDPHSSITNDVFIVDERTLLNPFEQDHLDVYSVWYNKGFDPIKFSNLEFGSEELVIAPDKGAFGRAQEFAHKFLDTDPIYMEKERKDGKVIYHDSDELKHVGEGSTVWVVDDICDGGATFISLAKELDKYNPSIKILVVSHGVFSNGLTELLEHYDVIYAMDNDFNRLKLENIFNK